MGLIVCMMKPKSLKSSGREEISYTFNTSVLVHVGKVTCETDVQM
jgi:hypothetical protein